MSAHDSLHPQEWGHARTCWTRFCISPRGGPEQQAIDAGEIDAIIDYSRKLTSFLLPAARNRNLLDRAPPITRDQAGRVVANNLLSALPNAEVQRLLGGP